MTESDIKRIAVHEIGHHIIGTHFGLSSCPQIFADVDVNTAESTTVTLGQCEIDPTTPFQKCCIGWAGALAEAMTGVHEHWMPAFPPSERDLKDWHSIALKRLHFFSESDRRMIIGCVGKSWRACRTAFAILFKNRIRLRRLARFYEKDALQKQKQPMTQANSQSEAIQFRAQALENFLKIIRPDDPEKARLERSLEYLRRGAWPPEEVTQPATKAKCD